MKEIAEITKSIILATFMIVICFDIIILAGEDNGEMGIAKFFIIKSVGLAGAYGLYKLGVLITKKNLLPNWWNKMIAEMEKDQEI